MVSSDVGINELDLPYGMWVSVPVYLVIFNRWMKLFFVVEHNCIKAACILYSEPLCEFVLEFSQKLCVST